MRFLFVWVLIALAAAAHADTKAISDTQAAKELAESAMKKFVAGDMAGGFDLLKPYWHLPDTEISQLVLQSIQQRSALQSRYGASLGYEYIAWTAVGDSLVRFVYLEKNENHPYTWQFYFYKAKDVWLVDGVGYNDRVQELFR